MEVLTSNNMVEGIHFYTSSNRADSTTVNSLDHNCDSDDKAIGVVSPIDFSEPLTLKFTFI